MTTVSELEHLVGGAAYRTPMASAPMPRPRSISLVRPAQTRKAKVLAGPTPSRLSRAEAAELALPLEDTGTYGSF
jgi:hypothetical protein